MIHFASLFCTDFDSDLAGPWIRHYLSMNLDSYTVWLNTQTDDYDTLNRVSEEFKSRGVHTHVATGPFDDGHLRTLVMEPFAASLPVDDILVTADSDELHAADRATYERHEVTMGITVDRYDSTLHAADPLYALEVQYPHEGNVEAEVIKSLPESSRYAWPRINKNKICAARAGLPVSFAGSHCIYPWYVRTVDYSSPIKALHYCWRDSILRRMAGKHYYDAAVLWYVWKFFGGVQGSEPPELLDAIEREEKRQQEKGWVPCSWEG